MMGSKRLAWISFAISTISLVVSIIVLVNYCPTQDIYSHFDYMGVIVGILALLVTALIGAQVGQYVFVYKKIEGITKPITRIVARTVAAEVAQRETPKIAKEIAQEKALGVVGGLPNDLLFVLRGKDLIYKSTNELEICRIMTAIDYTIKALQEFKQCSTEALYQSTIDDTLETLKNHFEWSSKNGGLRILSGQRNLYESIMSDIRSEKLQVCIDYLSQAEDMDKDEDDKIREMKVEG